MNQTPEHGVLDPPARRLVKLDLGAGSSRSASRVPLSIGLECFAPVVLKHDLLVEGRPSVRAPAVVVAQWAAERQPSGGTHRIALRTTRLDKQDRLDLGSSVPATAHESRGAGLSPQADPSSARHEQTHDVVNGSRPLRHTDGPATEAASDVASTVGRENAPLHLHPNGYVHGGVCVAFGDTGAARGTFRNLPQGYDFTTAELKANVVAAGRLGDTLTAIGHPLHIGRRTQVWEVRISTGGKVTAFFSCTALVLTPG